MGVNITAATLTNSAVGWQPGCNTRGTFDILWSCIQTVALCAWVSVCANVPAPEHGEWDIVTDKFFFTLMTLLGPEFIFLLAFGQYQTAKASVSMFKSSGFDDWTLTHGFYADMGGVHIQPKEWKRFPVNSKQLHWLVVRGYMEYPSITEKDIKCGGKIDGLARFITLVQALNFFVTTIARLATGLAITTLELTVLANIFCTLCTYICWWNKPCDVEVGHLFHLNKSMEDILREAGSAADEYRDTPLDFVSRDEWAGSLLWNYYVNILRRLGLLSMFRLHYARPAQRVNTFNFPKPGSRRVKLFLLLITAAYTATFLGAWNFYFPTPIEKTLWRVVALTQITICTLGAGFEIIYHDAPPHPRRELVNVVSTKSISDIEAAKPSLGKTMLGAFSNLWNIPCSNETGNFPSLDVPLRSLVITTPICAAYCICRWAILAEDVVSVRLLPASAYETVNWTTYWPGF